MALKTIVKVGRISNLSDARYCAGMGVNFLGFQVIEGSSNYISPNQFQEFRGWFTGPEIIAEVYGLKSEDELNGVTDGYAPNLIEFSAAELGSNMNFSQNIILRITANDFKTSTEAIERIRDKVSFIELSGDVSKKDVALIAQSFKVLVAVRDVNDLELKLSWPITGIALEGTLEEKPGLKSYDSLAEILEALEIND